jgi:hypothetical protein
MTGRFIRVRPQSLRNDVCGEFQISANERDGWSFDSLIALKAEEFIRRFLLHVLPGGFVRIRHFGFLANGHRETKLALCRELLGVPQVDSQQSCTRDDWKTRYEMLTGVSLTLCPACHRGRMVTVEILWPQKQPQGIDSS